ncbi:MAG TPA: hypothetical protein P5572_13850 [Phycisphaerae bacterium]|nr:hypothetical protein [Phycisphaerales bacterium]HRX86099.1 hypothetical protein [Phycisphaerae bacterium]
MTKHRAAPGTSPAEENKFHTYTTHRIPWFVRFIWICFWIGLVWYIVRWAIPSAKNYF